MGRKRNRIRARCITRYEKATWTRQSIQKTKTEGTINTEDSVVVVATPDEINRVWTLF